MKCIQINLRHSKTASAALAQVLLDLNIDVALVQEPYAFSSTVPVLANIPSGFSSFHKLTSDHAYGTAILIRDSFSKSATLSSTGPPNLSTCVRVPTRSGSLSLCSAYLRPSLTDFGHTAAIILEGSSTPLSIVGMDSNAKNPLWNSSGNDSRGRDLEALTIKHKLNIANRPRADLDFVPTGTSFVDITLAGDQIVVSRWQYLAIPSLSDHPYIYFEVEIAGMAPPPTNPSVARRAPALSGINKTPFLANLTRLLPSLEQHLVSVSSLETTELEIVKLSTVLVSCAVSAKMKAPKAVKSKNMPWWTTELCALRTKARTSFKAWSRSESSADEISYRRSKSNYQRALRRAKSKAWADFRQRASSGDTFKVLAEFSGKSHSIPIPPELVVNGLLTSDPAVIAEGCADHFFRMKNQLSLSTLTSLKPPVFL